MPIIWDEYGASGGPLEEVDPNAPRYLAVEVPIPHYDQFTQDIHEVLETWFQAMEGNYHGQWPPQADFPKTWTNEQLQELVDYQIEGYVRAQMGWNNGRAENGILRRQHRTEGPGFTRLEVPQRLALAQDLYRVCQRHNVTVASDEPVTRQEEMTD